MFRQHLIDTSRIFIDLCKCQEDLFILIFWLSYRISPIKHEAWVFYQGSDIKSPFYLLRADFHGTFPKN
jgi:hypothetical protein